MSAVARAAGTALLAVIVVSVLMNLLAYAGSALAWRRRDTICELLDDEPPPPWPARALAWLRTFALECAATAGLALSAPLAMNREVVRGSGRPVVIVAGWLQHRGQLGWLAHRLRRDGRSVAVVSAPGHDVESRAASLSNTLERLRRATGAPTLDLVACGTGGLVVRACVREHGGGRGIGRLITLGTPHQGTLAFPWLRGLGMTELRPASALIGRLGSNDPVPTTADCIAIYSVDDAFVLPADAAYYGGAFNIELRGLGHLSLAYSGRVHELIRENLAADAVTRHGALSASDARAGR